MPKITVNGGASYEVPPETPAEEAECPGNSSETSPESTPKSSETNEDSPPQRVRTTESRSKRGRTADSSVRSTDTDRPHKG